MTLHAILCCVVSCWQSSHPVRRRTPLNLYVSYLRLTPDDRSTALIKMLEDLKDEYPDQVAATARAAASIAGTQGASVRARPHSSCCIAVSWVLSALLFDPHVDGTLNLLRVG